MRDNNRKSDTRTEGILSLAVLAILLPALALVFLAKWHIAMPESTVLINEATPENFASTLGIDSDVAERIAAYRKQAGGFDDTDRLLTIPLFSSSDAKQAAQTFTQSRLDLRTATATQFAEALKLRPAIAARLAAYRDTHIFDLPPVPVAGTGAAIIGSTGNSASRPALPDVTPPTALFRHATALDPNMAAPLVKRFVLRRPGDVFRTFVLVTLLLSALIVFIPVWLRKQQKLGGDPFLIPLALLLSGMGVVMLFSIKNPFRDGAAYLHHTIGIVIAVIGMLLCAKLARSARGRIRHYQYVWVAAAVGLVVMLFVFGRGPDGVKLNLFGIQPVELIKLFLVFFAAAYLADRAALIADASRRYTPPKFEGVKRSNGRPTLAVTIPRAQDIGPVAVMFGFSLVLFFVIKDLGPGLLLFAVFIAMLYLTTGKSSFVAIGVALILVGGCLGYLRHVGVFGTRVDMWLSPFANAHPNGMQLGQSYWGIASGGWEGSGLGLGMPGLTPRAGSDLAFVSWVEETGLPGAWLVLTAYALLVWRGMRIALRTGSEFDRALAFGLTALLGLQTLLILFGVTGVTPLTGISLPFLSYGNSALVADFVIIGLLRGISVPAPGGDRLEVRHEILQSARRFAVTVAAALIGIVGVWRLGSMQLIRSDEFAARPIITPDADKVMRPHQNPRLLAIANAIQRGSIYDVQGRVLATNREKEIDPLEHDIPKRDRLLASRTRFYPFGPALAHLVGYVDPGVGGPFGFEKHYDSALRGYGKITDLLHDYRNRSLPFFHARQGSDLRLTIDAVLQRRAQNILWQTASKVKDKVTGKPKDRAAFVLISPQTGDVLVAATTPSFDPNTLTPEQVHRFTSSPDAELEHRFINRAVHGVYPPGSTLKVATAACALDNMPDALQFTVPCNQIADTIAWKANGKSYVRRNVRDDKGDLSYGTIALSTAFKVSSNIYFANLAVAIGPDVLRETLRDKMGFGHVPRQPEFDADLPDIGYGQGRMWATPLEMARLAGAVANEGKMMQSRYATSLTDPSGQAKKLNYAPSLLAQSMKPQTAAILRDLMRGVVTEGTARGVFDSRLQVAGKTGTAQNRQFDNEPHSWFIGFAPYTSGQSAPPPKYAFACIVENGGYGKRVAAVICRDLLRHLY